MLKQTISRRNGLLLGLLSVILLLALYSTLSWRQHRKNPEDTTIPGWSQLATGVIKSVEPNSRSGERWILVDSRATAGRLFLGLFYGVAGAVLIGLLMGCFPVAEALLAPPMSLLAKVPPTAALAVFFVLVGTDTSMFVAMIAFGVLPTLAQSVYLAVRDVRQEMLFKAYTLGASSGELIWNVIIPIIMPRLIDAIRLQIGPAMVFLIAAEMVVGDVGFGYRIRLQSRLLNMSVVYPYLAVLAAFGFMMDFILRHIQKKCFAWYSKQR
ncbi:ABC transporter permease subunit [bacterium]|nr:ABC transporter permease subunit [candidate division CSSED10-310 bacterium]